MAIGDLGLLLELAVSLTPEFATIQHQQMEGNLVLVLLLKVFHAACNHALQVCKSDKNVNKS
jgi:hypothetical protein